MAAGQAVRFDTEGDGVTLSPTGLWTGPWTVFLRGRISVDRNEYSTTFEIGDGGSSNYYQCGTGANGVTLDAFLSGAGTPASPYTATVGTWFDFAVVRTGTDVNVYAGTLGGSLITYALGVAGSAVTNNRLYIGWSESWATEWFNGEIGGVKAWNVALSAGEIATERGYYRAVRQTNLRGEWFMDGPSLLDASTVGNNLTQRTTMPGVVAGPSVPYAPSASVDTTQFFLSA